jgi:NADPH2:quinone reductase
MKALIPTGDLQMTVRLADVPEPGLLPSEALVAGEAFSINRGETFLLEQPKLNWRPGKDVAGRVVRAAADGSGPPQGTRVVAHPPAAGWAERVAVSTRQIAILPDGIDFNTAAASPLAGLTALRLLRVAGSISSRRILMTGASDGVGHYFTELAASVGAELTVVSADAERGRRLGDLGAIDIVYDVGSAEGPFDLILESVGGASLQEALMKLAPHGKLIWFGQASREAPTLDFFSFWKGPASGSIHHFDYTDSDVPDDRDLETLVRLVGSGRLHPEIGYVAHWNQAAPALASLRGRTIRGNAVLTTGAS